MEDFSNKIVGGCRLENLLGKGGMGSVYKAHHLNLDIPVAVKFLDKSLSGSSELVDRFILEARAAARLDSPYIVRVFQVGAEENSYFIQMEFVEGESLAQKLKREAPLPLDTALLYLYQIAMGLAAAHQAGIVHRDIKPENILISSKGVLKITDFGLAKSLQSASHLTRSGEILGTPYYLSPEQCEGQPTDARSDIYSLGVTFYYMITGRLPFQGETPIGIAVARLRFDAPMPRSHRPDISEEVERMTMRMMARLPEQRYPSIEALLQEVVDMMPRYGANFPRQATVAMPFTVMPLPAAQDRQAGGTSRVNQSASNPTMVGSENKANSLAGDNDEVIPSSPTMALGTAPAKENHATLLEGVSQPTLVTSTPLNTIRRDVSVRSETRSVAPSLAPLTSIGPAGAVTPPTGTLPPAAPATAAAPAPTAPAVGKTPGKSGSRLWRWFFDLACASVLAFALFTAAKQEVLAQMQALRDHYAPQLNNAADWQSYQNIVAMLPCDRPAEIDKESEKFLKKHGTSRYALLVRDIQKDVARRHQQMLAHKVDPKPDKPDNKVDPKPDKPDNKVDPKPDKPDNKVDPKPDKPDNKVDETEDPIVSLLSKHNREKMYVETLKAIVKMEKERFENRPLLRGVASKWRQSLRSNNRTQSEILNAFKGYNKEINDTIKAGKPREAKKQLDQMTALAEQLELMMAKKNIEEVSNMIDKTQDMLEAAENKKQPRVPKKIKKQEPDEEGE